MKANNLVNADELYLVIGQDENATETQPGLMSAADKVKLNGIADGAEVNVQSDWNITNTTSDAYIKNKPKALPANGGNADTVNNHTVETNVPAGAVFTDTVYTHPTYTAKANGLYKITVDSTGHVNGTNSVSKADITALGIPAQDTTYGEAGTSLGLVKSGGDVTISSGIITVNDDSHNHTINNIDNLQTTLDSKVDKVAGSRLITASEASKLESLVIGEGGQIEISGKVNADNVEGLTEKLNTKVDKVAGKGLSTNDYTTEEKEKLAGLNSANYVAKSGDTMTGKLTAPQIETGAADTNYFQSRKFRGEGDASTYYHAIDFGYANHDQVDFYEYGGLWNFYKNTSSTKGGTLCGKISVNGWEGSAKLTGTPTAPTAASETNNTQIATTAFVQTATSGKVDKVTGKGLSTNDYTTAEKDKLASIENGANKTVVDTALNSTSANPLQNKAIYTKFNSIQSDIDNKVPSSRSINGKALTADITLSASDVGALPNTTVIPSINGLATETYVNNKVASIVDSAPATLDTLNELAAALGDDPNFATTVATQIGNKVDKVDGKGLSTNDYTTAEKNKLSGIAAKAEVNQNAFSNIVVGSTTVAADSKTDTLTLVAGTNVTLTPDATNDKITIAATDTVYTHPSYTAKSSGLYKITVDSTGHVSATTAVAKSDITGLGIPAQDTTYSEAGTSLGLVKSGGDVTISSGIITVNDDSHNHTISNIDNLQATLNNKVDKVDGKGLSANDYTTAEKDKLASIENGANKTVVDTALSSTSANPVENKAIYAQFNSISAEVKQVKDDFNNNIEVVNEDIQTLTQKVNATMTAEDVKLQIQSELNNGVTKVKTTTGFTFDDEGLTVSKSGSEMTTQITEDGMTVFRDNTAILTANNVGVDAVNLHATTYLIIGTHSRFEDYGEDRTGCFWIGN